MPEDKEAAAPEPLELSQDELGQVLAGKLDIEALIAAQAKRQSPHPTLESIHDELDRWRAWFDANLAMCHENRQKMRADSEFAVLVRGLHYKDFAGVKSAMTGLREEHKAFWLQLSGEQITEVMLSRMWTDSTATLQLGMYVGAQLAKGGFSMEEVVRLASDPVFVVHAIAGKVVPGAAVGLGLKCLDELKAIDTASATSTKDPA